MNIEKGCIVRTVVLIFALVNQALVISGKSVLPFAEDSMAEFVSLIITGMASLAAWWKNNSFTKEAIEADEYLYDLKNEEVVV